MPANQTLCNARFSKEPRPYRPALTVQLPLCTLLLLEEGTVNGQNGVWISKLLG